MRRKISIAIISIILLLASMMIVGSTYYAKEFSNQGFDQLIFYLLNGIQGTSQSVIQEVIRSNIISVIILWLILVVLTYRGEKRIILKIRLWSKHLEKQIFPIRIISKHRFIYTLLILIIATIILIQGLKIDIFVKNNIQTTNIYEKYYVDGKQINIKFPEQKRNLIFISAESMETTLCSKENGGGWEYSIIPELEQLELDYINFSNTDALGGPMTVAGTSFTAGGLVAETAGLPLNIAIENFAGSNNYLENMYSIGDILQKEGYNLEVMMGSDGTFGGKSQYFISNGNYKVFDYNYAIEQGKMTKEEKKWWGFEDDRLFAWAKEETVNLATQNKPFNLIIHTADTHFVDGFLSDNAEIKFESKYENVHAYSSKLISEFVRWIQEQPFYENTTIVIIGDHLGMQTTFYTEHVSPDYQRTVYNVIINSAIEGVNTHNRVFNTMDMFPTILASMGVEIEGERIGLGTNMFSEKNTLMEELGTMYVMDELNKRSDFYNNLVYGRNSTFIDTLFKLIKK